MEVALEAEQGAAIGRADLEQAAAPAVVFAADQAVGFRVAAVFGVVAAAGFIELDDFDIGEFLGAAVLGVAGQGDAGAIGHGGNGVGEVAFGFAVEHEVDARALAVYLEFHIEVLVGIVAGIAGQLDDGAVAFPLGGLAFDFQAGASELQVVAVAALPFVLERVGEVNLEVGHLARLPLEGETQDELLRQGEVFGGRGGTGGNQAVVIEGPVFFLLVVVEPLVEVARAGIDDVALADAELQRFECGARDFDVSGVGRNDGEFGVIERLDIRR